MNADLDAMRLAIQESPKASECAELARRYDEANSEFRAAQQWHLAAQAVAQASVDNLGEARRKLREARAALVSLVGEIQGQEKS